MSVSFGCDSDQHRLVEKECDGSASNTSRLFEPATHNFPILAIWLVEVVITFDAHFLLALFPFGLTKPRIGRPQWLTGMH